MDEFHSLDADLEAGMTFMFNLIRALPGNPDNDDQLRMRIVSTNLQALAEMVLVADEHPETFNLNLKKVALGLLGTSAWLTASLPNLDIGFAVQITEEDDTNGDSEL